MTTKEGCHSILFIASRAERRSTLPWVDLDLRCFGSQSPGTKSSLLSRNLSGLSAQPALPRGEAVPCSVPQSRWGFWWLFPSSGPPVHRCLRIQATLWRCCTSSSRKVCHGVPLKIPGHKCPLQKFKNWRIGLTPFPLLPFSTQCNYNLSLSVEVFWYQISGSTAERRQELQVGKPSSSNYHKWWYEINLTNFNSVWTPDSSLCCWEQRVLYKYDRNINLCSKQKVLSNSKSRFSFSLDSQVQPTPCQRW